MMSMSKRGETLPFVLMSDVGQMEKAKPMKLQARAAIRGDAASGVASYHAINQRDMVLL